MAKRREIRNSTAEFLIFQIEGKEQGVEVYYKDKTVWCTQKAMGILFDCSTDNVGLHLKNIFASGELVKDSVTEKISATASDGKNYMTQFYNLKRMENGTFLDEDYFEHLLAEIREIRLSERRFYQKLTDIYATAIDYNRDAPTTKLFFKMMQNKMHYAVHGRTAAELIVERADAEQEHMGLTTWENAPDGKIVKTDVAIAKNYLKEVELADMGQLVNGVLELAERMAKRHIPMTMEDWAKQIDTILAAGGNEMLQTAGSVTAEEAKEHAETEFEKYRIIQDRLFQSDFDKFLGELPFENLDEKAIKKHNGSKN